MKSNVYRTAIFNVLGLSLVTVGLFYHVIQGYFVNDASYISYLIASFLFGNIILSTWDTIKPTKWIDGFMEMVSPKLLYLGMLASVIGLTAVVAAMVMAIDGGGSSAADLVINSMKAAATGVRTAFGPTAVGLVAYLWTEILLYLKDIFDETEKR